MRVNQAVDVLVKEVQVVEEVKATEVQKARIAEELKATGVHLHPVEWELLYGDGRRGQLDQWSLTAVQPESSVSYAFRML